MLPSLAPGAEGLLVVALTVMVIPLHGFGGVVPPPLLQDPLIKTVDTITKMIEEVELQSLISQF